MTPVPHKQQTSGLSRTDCDDFLPAKIYSATKLLY